MYDIFFTILNLEISVFKVTGTTLIANINGFQFMKTVNGEYVLTTNGYVPAVLDPNSDVAWELTCLYVDHVMPTTAYVDYIKQLNQKDYTPKCWWSNVSGNVATITDRD